MGYEYIFLAAAIILPLGIFSVFKGNPAAAQVSNEKRSSLPGAFGNDSASTKSKKKKNKKKNKGTSSSTTGATGPIAGHDNDDGESSESEAEEKKTMTRQNKKLNNNTKSNNTSAQIASSAKKASSNNSKGSNATVSSFSPSSTSNPSTNNNNNNNKSTGSNNQESVKIKASNNSNISSKQPVVSTPTVTSHLSAAGSKATSVEDWKKQRQAEQREILAKQQETLQFSSAAIKNTSSFSSSPNVTSIAGPGAMGNSKKKNRGQAGAGLSHAEFPTLSRPQPAPAPAPKQPKQKKEKKDKESVKPESVPEPVPESVPESVPAQEFEEESEEDNPKEQQLRDDQLMAQQLAWSEGEKEQEEEEEEDEWTTVSGNGAAPVRSGGIDFSKPMDPWVAQRQRQLQDEIAAADPHGEQTAHFARVLSIKPAAKEERFREAIPDGFSVQKTRSGASTGSSSYQSTEMTKKQRENLAKAAKRKEDKAAADALQEKRKQEHMRQVKAEKMKEFYRSQPRKSTPVETRWDVPKSSNLASSTVSGGVSAQVNDKGQLIWD
ncbi:hypothetical protein BGZ47_002915 [Haplosporangium gracile]|nr:hypothetical protein BGZ47_002915 [Haplosporangium gracile]